MRRELVEYALNAEPGVYCGDLYLKTAGSMSRNSGTATSRRMLPAPVAPGKTEKMVQENLRLRDPVCGRNGRRWHERRAGPGQG